MNIMAKSSLAHAKSSGSTLYAVLSLNILQSLDHDKIIALKEIGIFSLGDLLHFKPIIYAQILVSVSNRDIGHDVSVERYLDNSYLSTLQSDIPNLPIVAIEGLGALMEAKFNTAFGITIIKELALFEPFIEAQQYLLPDKEVFNERPSAPEDLMPKILGSVHSIARFNSYIKSSQINFGNENLSLEANEIDELNSELYNIFTTKKFKLYTGFIAGFKQSWMNVGTHLGEIIHSLALAPGESRNISIIEWYRRQSSSRDEKTKVDERLSNSLVHSRALNEVVKTTAIEHLSGSTEIDSTTKTSGFGITAAGAGGSSNGSSSGGSGNVSGSATDGVLGIGANIVGGFAKSALSTITGAIGLSAVFSKNEQVGTLKSESSGVREVIGETQQNINDSTVQNSSNIRSLYSTIVVTDEQAETENIQTKNVTNYNHSHSLTIQYYEVLQRYEVAIKLDSWTPVVYLPFKPISFDVNVVQKYWHLLRTPIISSFPELFDRFNTFFKGYNPLNPNFDISNNVKVVSIKATSSSSGGTYWYNQSSGLSSITMPVGNPGFTLTMTINNPALTFYPLASPTFDLPITSPLNLSDLKEIYLKWSSVHLGDAPNNPNDEIKVDINLEFSLTDEDNNSVIAKKTYSRIIKFAELYAGIITPILVTANLSDDLENSLTSAELFNSTDVNEEIEKHFKTYKYAYTRYLLGSIEGDQLSDIIESLSFDSPGTTYLESYIHTTPIAITENYLVFKHKKIPIPTGVNPCSPEFESLNDPIWAALISLQCNVEEYKNAKDTKSIDTVFLPTAGVFAEAILGRSNASEFVDPRRFWNWQDSPIPFSAPQIAAIQAGNQIVTDLSGVLSPNVPTSNLNIINPPQYALPTTLSSALQAVQNGNMFRDMSKSGELVSILSNLATLASTTATLAGNLSGDAAENALNGAVELGKQVAGMVNKATETWAATNVAPPPISATDKAAALNAVESFYPTGGNNDGVNQKKESLFGVSDNKLVSNYPSYRNSFSLRYMIENSVGENGVNNAKDVLTVRNRLTQLGFFRESNVVNSDLSTVDVEFIEKIILFQSIIRGNSSLSGDGRIDPMGYTHQWLNANNAPVWTKLGDGSLTNRALGYYNSTKDEMDYFGTDWLISTIVKAGNVYYQAYLNNNPSASVMWINDLSLTTGGPYPPHGTHQTGLDVDVRLPKTNGESGGITFSSSDYDRDATREMLKAFKSCLLVKSILFNDSVLIGESLCNYYSGHDNHFHVKIEPPIMGELLSVILPIDTSLEESKYI